MTTFAAIVPVYNRPDEVDELLDKMSYAHITKQDDFFPEDHGYLPLEPECHEHEICFHPDTRTAVCMIVKPWQRTHYANVDPQTLRKFFAWRSTEKNCQAAVLDA